MHTVACPVIDAHFQCGKDAEAHVEVCGRKGNAAQTRAQPVSPPSSRVATVLATPADPSCLIDAGCFVVVMAACRTDQCSGRYLC